MNVINISDLYPIVDHIMAQLRDVSIQKDRMRFNDNIYLLGQILAIEAGKYLKYELKDIVTPFSTTNIRTLSLTPVLYGIARAGIRLQEGASTVYSGAKHYICTCKKHPDGKRDVTLSMKEDLSGRVLIICDPIMTTAKTMRACIREITQSNMPDLIIVFNVISTPLSIGNLTKDLPEASILLTCAIDQFKEGVRGTIPGLGDAGDLLYGIKRD